MSGETIGTSEYETWYHHNKAHELEPGTPQHTEAYKQFFISRVKRDALLFLIDENLVKTALGFMVAAVQMHDKIELDGRDDDYSEWEPIIEVLSQYFEGLNVARGILEEGRSHIEAELELNRWFAHRHRDYQLFHELTCAIYKSQFDTEIPYEVCALFTMAVVYHDMAEEEGNEHAEEQWNMVRLLLEEHYRRLFLITQKSSDEES